MAIDEDFQWTQNPMVCSFQLNLDLVSGMKIIIKTIAYNLIQE